MADKTIGELVAATQITPTDLFVLEQNNVAKKLTGQVLENWLVSYADGHGGIQSLTKTSSTGTNPVVDTYTITYADTTTSTFTVTNGVKGDTGAAAHVYIKYSSAQPVRDSDMYDTPDAWMGIYVGTASTAPTTYTSYAWYKVKGETGGTGSPATITSQTVEYQVGTSGTVAPSGTWTTTVPTVPQGSYLWTRTTVRFNTGNPVVSYSVGRMGVDGAGSVVSVNNQSPDGNGNVTVTASDIQMSDNRSVEEAIESAGAVNSVNHIYPDSSKDVSITSNDIPTPSHSSITAALDAKINTSDALTLEEISASSDLSGKVTGAEATKELVDFRSDTVQLDGTWSNYGSITLLKKGKVVVATLRAYKSDIGYLQQTPLGYVPEIFRPRTAATSIGGYGEYGGSATTASRVDLVSLMSIRNDGAIVHVVGSSRLYTAYASWVYFVD